MTIIALIAAMRSNRVMGINNTMPWHIPEELKYFKAVTMGKPMIMGRKTFDAIGRRLLPGRQTIVLTKDNNLVGEGFIVAHSVPESLQAAGSAQEIMIVGGAGIYEEFLPLAQRLYLSIIPQVFIGDAYFPEVDMKQWQLVSETDMTKFKAKIFERGRLNATD